MPNQITLKVAEARQRDVGRGKVRIDDASMRAIGVTTGDVIEIIGKKHTGAISWPAYPEDQEEGIIRMDGIVRKNAGLSLGEKVIVKKADVKVAKNLTIAPTQYSITLDYGFETFVKRKLLGYPVIKGDTVLIPILGRAIPFIVTSTNPPGLTLITDTTKLKVTEKPIKEPETEMQQITYEDVGGLDEEIRKIREMVELPLKHPELFKRLGIDPPKGVLLHGPPGCGKTLIAKAVANESDAHFISIQGPEIMSKFYGECVAEDSLVFTNGSGLKVIKDTIRENAVHSIAGLNFETGQIDLLPVKELFDKGVQETLRITTPHGRIEVTPSSRLLTLQDGKPTWIFADNLTIGDQIASPKKLTTQHTEIPLLLSYLPDKTLIGGPVVKGLFEKASGYGQDPIMAQKLGITQRRYEDLKYSGRKIPAKYIKKLYNLFPEKEQNFLRLAPEQQIPLFMTTDLMYILGLLTGHGHLRYSHPTSTVTQIILTTKDNAIRNRYSEAIKSTFSITLKSDSGYEEAIYFNSRPIGDLLSNLGIPYSEKSSHVKVPSYALTLPDQMLIAYLQGLFDADGGIQLTSESKKKGRAIQIIYLSKSKELVEGVKLCLLRFGILSTMGYRERDQIWSLYISDFGSIERFRSHISFTHSSKLKRLKQEYEISHINPNYDRIPVAQWIYEIGKEAGITHQEFRQYRIKPRVRSLTREQLQTAYELLHEKGLDQAKLHLIQKLLNMEIIWTPIRDIEHGKAHVYDFEVPSHHNYITNGIIVHNSEARLREIFKEAEENAPSIVFIDELDAIAPKREEVTGEVERRVVAQLLTLMDGLQTRGQVIVVAATNRVNAVDPALRRPGRFDREIEIGVPDIKGRFEILQIHTRGMPLAKDVNLETLARAIHGYVGADTAALCREAAMKALRRYLPEINLDEEVIPPKVLEKLEVRMNDFVNAMKEIQPTAIREVYIEVPQAKWEDVGGLEEVKQELIEAVEWPINRSDLFHRIGITPPKGLLLLGPPGCGKTLLARAVANESEANFISVKGPELLSKWVGESEKAVREVFRKARMAAPCIIFFDEIDSIAPRRGSRFGDSHVTERVISQLLTEMDGLEDLQNVVVLAATNRPDILDPALLRPGRFDRLIYVPSPKLPGRIEIIKIHTKNMPLAPDVSIKNLASMTEGFVGSDLNALCREAGMIALRKRGLKAKNVKLSDFEEALKKIHPTATKEMLEWYERVVHEFKRTVPVESKPTFV